MPSLPISIKNYNVLKWKIHLVWGSTLPKIRITSKKALSKSCLKFNFVQKRLQAHMSISPWSGARGLERFASLKNNNV